MTTRNGQTYSVADLDERDRRGLPLRNLPPVNIKTQVAVSETGSTTSPAALIHDKEKNR